MRLFVVALLWCLALVQPAAAQSPMPLSFEEAIATAERAAE